MTDLHPPYNLGGKVILITGASSGIGRATAIACSKMGAVVILSGRNNERLQETFQAMVYSGHHQIYPLDLADDGQVEEFIASLREKDIRIHGLVHAAGVSATLPVKMTSPAKMREHLQINAIAGVSLLRELIRGKRFHSSGFSAVFIASVMGSLGAPGRTLYSMGKGAVLSAVRSMALELAGRGIRVNALSPGVVEGPMSGRSPYSQDPESLERVRSQHPLGLGQPDDVAYAAIYLLSDTARWITGTNLVVDGGYSAGKE